MTETRPPAGYFPPMVLIYLFDAKGLISAGDSTNVYNVIELIGDVHVSAARIIKCTDIS